LGKEKKNEKANATKNATLSISTAASGAVKALIFSSRWDPTSLFHFDQSKD